ncbi:hypothetical protein N9K77_02000 [bacterium]|nr:hypothetical protein [bacterium]
MIMHEEQDEKYHLYLEYQRFFLSKQESKRGLPTPSVAFYKIFGLSSLFPNSKKFGKYHLGYLSQNENHKVDVLNS